MPLEWPKSSLDANQQNIAEYLRHEHNADPPMVAIAEAAQDELGRLRDRISGQHRLAVTCDVRAGEAPDEIVAWARCHAIDLIVIGHRGQSRLAATLLGSVARQVVESAPCPVLIVR